MIMNRLMEFDYFYGAEAEQFSFIRLPKLLFKDRHFRSLSFEAKVVYGILLDRISLSVKNDWIDEENRVYISYTVSALAEEIGCSRDKAGRILSELDSVKGIGLVERKRRGLGRPDIMYVKNFVRITEDGDGDEDGNPVRLENGGSDCGNDAHSVAANNDIRKESERDSIVDNSLINRLSTKEKMPETLENTQMSQNTTSSCGKTRHQEAVKYDSKKPQITTSGCGNLRHLDVVKSGTNNTNINNTEHNDTDLIESLSFDKPIKLTVAGVPPEKFGRDRIDDEDPLIRRVKENIQYDWHMSHDSISDRGSWQNYFEMIKGMVIGEREKVRIGDATYPYSFVRERFLSLTEEHIYYAQHCVERDKEKIYNMKAYMMTTLFHAPETMDEYYKQLCTYNTEGDGWHERKSG